MCRIDLISDVCYCLGEVKTETNETIVQIYVDSSGKIIWISVHLIQNLSMFEDHIAIFNNIDF